MELFFVLIAIVGIALTFILGAACGAASASSTVKIARPDQWHFHALTELQDRYRFGEISRDGAIVTASLTLGMNLTDDGADALFPDGIDKQNRPMGFHVPERDGTVGDDDEYEDEPVPDFAIRRRPFDFSK